MHPSHKLLSPHHLESMKNHSTYWTHTSTSILPRTCDWNIKRFQLHHCLFGWHHHLQQDSRRAPRPHKQVFEKLRSAHLSMKLSKSHFFTKEIQYLWHILSTKGNIPLPSKTQAIKTCTHQRHPNRYVHFLDSWDTIENLSGTSWK